jgi:hypothetical protein
MPAQFRQFGLSFLYPENWVIDRDEAPADGKSVTIYSPGGGFWSVAVHPGSADPLKLADAAVQTMKLEYKDMEIVEVHETVSGREMVGFDMNFFLFDFTNTAQIRSLKCNQNTYTIFCQAEDQEYAQISEVFRAMTVSLLNGLKDLSHWS